MNNDDFKVGNLPNRGYPVHSGEKSAVLLGWLKNCHFSPEAFMRFRLENGETLELPVLKRSLAIPGTMFRTEQNHLILEYLFKRGVPNFAEMARFEMDDTVRFTWKCFVVNLKMSEALFDDDSFEPEDNVGGPFIDRWALMNGDKMSMTLQPWQNSVLPHLKEWSEEFKTRALMSKYTGLMFKNPNSIIRTDVA